MFAKKLISVALIASLAVTPSGYASVLGQTLDSMFISNATSPGGFASQSRFGLAGGGLAMRAPQSNMNISTFDPPRVSAGCGGIDLYGGSFSFINADQLSALFRQIAANAIGVAFMMAIEAISPQIANVMKTFQSMMQAMNSMNKNTCAIAHQLTKTAADVITGKQELSEVTNSAISSAKGAASDVFASIQKLFSSPGANDTDAASDCTGCGNLTWRALSKSNAGNIFVKFNIDQGGSGNAADIQNMNEIIMSLVGTVIVTKESASKTAAATTAAGGQKAPAETPNHTEPILSLKDLAGNSDKLITYWKCNTTTADGCTTLTKTQMTFEGANGYARRMLLGTGGILEAAKTCTNWSTCFNASQRQFLDMISSPVLGIMMSVQQTNGAMETIADLLVEPVAQDLLVAMGQAAVKAVTQSYDGVIGVDTDPAIRTNVKAVKDDLNSELIRQSLNVTKIQNAIHHADLMIKNNAALFVSFK